LDRSDKQKLPRATGRSSNVRLDALAVACPGSPDLQAHLERTVAPADLEYPVLLASLDAHHQCAKNPHHHPAAHALLDHLDQLDPLEPLEALDVLDPLAAMETMAHLVPLGHKDHLDPLEMLDQMDNLEILDLPQPVNHSFQGILDHKETPARRGFLETLVHLGAMVNQETTVQRALLDPLDHRDHLATMDSLVLLDHLAPLERGVFVQNTVLWTVECSSKMVHAVKWDELSRDVLMSTFQLRQIFFVVSFVAFCTW